MSLRKYLSEKLGALLTVGVGLAALCLFLAGIGVGVGENLLVGCGFAAVALAYFTVDFFAKKLRADRLSASLVIAQDSCLWAETAEAPRDSEARAYYDAMKRCSREALARELAGRKREEEFTDYIEKWVHEVKTPVTALRLIAENAGGKLAQELLQETDKLFSLSEQALYYARSEAVEKDCFIARTDLGQLLNEALLEQKTALLAAGVAVDAEELSGAVYTDRKWMRFVLSQILSNCVKYRRTSGARVRAYSEEQADGTALCVRDNGAGIPAADLGRIFEKGFTGGDRSKRYSTGMGLYLAKKLCEKLNVGLSARSEEGVYTELRLFFPRGAMHVLDGETAGLTKS